MNSRVPPRYPRNSKGEALGGFWLFFWIYASIGYGQPAQIPSPTDKYGSLPITFEANLGQSEPGVRFLGRMGAGSIHLMERDIVFRSAGGKTVNLHLAGRKKPEAIDGLTPSGGTSNYFIGNSANWRTNIPNFLSVRYKQLYPGIDLIVRSLGRKAEYDFLLSPNANPNLIEMDFSGAKELKLTATGDLRVVAEGFEMVHHKPLMYQSYAGGRREVAGRFVLRGKDRVAFKVGAYNRAEPLVIDPVLTYSAVISGSGVDVANAIAVDAVGNAYVTGTTGSQDFPVTAGALTNKFDGSAAFVYKLNPSGTTILYSAVVGGSFGYNSNSSGNAIAVNGSEVYVTGGTNAYDFPTTAGAFQSGFAPPQFSVLHGFVFKLNATGDALGYSTYLRGSSQDSGLGIAVDPSGNAYVSGSTFSPDFPSTLGALKTSAIPISGTAFVSKVNPTGSAVVYSTFLGGSGAHNTGETANAIAIDGVGNAYVAGTTTSSDFPTVPGSYQTDGSDADLGYGFVTKLNAVGSGLLYSTFVPGGTVSANGIAVDLTGAAYVALSSNYLSIPTVPMPTGSVVLKLNPSGTAPEYVSVIGPNQGSANAIAIDPGGNAYVTGWTSSSSFPVVSPIQASPGIVNDQTRNVIIVALNAVGVTTFSTYLGGRDNGDTGYGIATSNGTIYVAGHAGSSRFPVTPGAAGNSSGNGFDTFVAAVNLFSGCTFSLSQPAGLPASGGSGSITVSTQSSCTWVATSNPFWVTISAGASGSGPGTVDFTVAPSIVPPRSASLSVAGLSSVVSQADGCTFSLTANSASVPASGGLIYVNLITGAGCTFTASTPPSWIEEDAGLPFTEFIFNVIANTTGPPRSATLTLAGQSYTINQDGGGFVCPFALQASQSFSALGTIGSFQVTTLSTCAWSAISNSSWLHVDQVEAANGGDPVNGIGSGHVNLHLDTNAGQARLGTVTAGTQLWKAMQAGSASVVLFNDVPAAAPYFDYISLMKSYGITAGCSVNPPLYCPDTPVTRAQMSVFIVAALNNALGTSLTYTQTPYFQDVDSTSIYFPFVQRIKDLGITAGCSTTPALFCPDSSITQGQMAVFMIVSWMLANNLQTFDYTQTPYFTDVASTDIYFPFVQKMRDLGFWTGCSQTQYCENTAVTRSNMAPMVMRSILGAP